MTFARLGLEEALADGRERGDCLAIPQVPSAAQRRGKTTDTHGGHEKCAGSEKQAGEKAREQKQALI